VLGLREDNLLESALFCAEPTDGMLWPYQGGTHNARPGAWAIGLGTLLQDGITVEGGVTVCQEVATQTQGSVGDGKIAGRSIGQIPKSRTDQIMRTLKVCIN